jgi:hypothetical protein
MRFFESSLRHVSIPRTVEIICSFSFSGRKSLQEITFETDYSLKRIESSAFFGSSLRSISIPSRVAVIGGEAFAHCSSLVSVTFKGVSELAEVCSSAFAFTPRLQGLSLPAGARLVEKLELNCSSSDRVPLDSESKVGAQLPLVNDPAHERSGIPPDISVFSDRFKDFDDFQFVSVLGQTVLCTVEQYRNPWTGQEIAVKSFSLLVDRWKKSFIREIEVLLNMHNPCIVSLIGFSLRSESSPARLATAYVDGLSLKTVLESKPEWWTPTIQSQTVAGIVGGMV